MNEMGLINKPLRKAISALKLIIEIKFCAFVLLTYLSIWFFCIISITEEVNANDAYLCCGFILIELIYKMPQYMIIYSFLVVFVVVIHPVDDLVVCVKSHYPSLDMINWHYYLSSAMNKTRQNIKDAYRHRQ